MISVLSIFACILGAVACGLFAFRECDSKTWWSICEFATKRLANKVTSVVLLVFLAISVIISVYASIISCCYGYVFVKTSGDRKRRIPIPIPVASSSPKVLVAEENHSKDFTVVDNETHRKQYYSYSSESDDEDEGEDDRTPQPEHEALLYQDQMHEQARLHHLQMQQTPNYIAVLNDPAMKQKLRERNTRLQQN